MRAGLPGRQPTLHYFVDVMVDLDYFFEAMTTESLFAYQPGINWRKEQALRMLSDGRTEAEVCLELRISSKTLTAWIKSGLPAGDPDLDQLSFVDGMSERERQRLR